MTAVSSETLPVADLQRLHITPFNPDIANRILPPTLQALARNLSFHAVQTFPEKGYGFVELPKMEADKLKKKLNGAVLKGSKVRIEEARPVKKRKSDADEGDAVERKSKKPKKEKKEKRSKGKDVVEGFELPEGRHVKRGWEDKVVKKTKDKKSKDKGAKSKDVKDRKMLFKTAPPANAVPVAEKGAAKAKKDKKEKKEKKGKKMVVVDEFGKTVRPTAGAEIAVKDVSQTAAFEDDKGWINAEGDTVEPAPKSKRPRPSRQSSGSTSKEVEVAASSSDESSILDDSSVLSDDSDSNEAASEDDETNTGKNLENAGPKEVHPLEALFKRPAPQASDKPTAKPKPSPIDTSFSFFNSGADEDEDGEADDVVRAIPQTPHTKQDMEWRQIRSAAPTPDTAAIGKRFRFPTPIENVQEDDDESATVQEGSTEPSKADEPEESEFRKWFYENRGDLNRSWKKRRREERKAKRQRENRRISRRVV